MVMEDSVGTHVHSEVRLTGLLVFRGIQHQIVNPLEDDGLAGVLVSGPHELHSVPRQQLTEFVGLLRRHIGGVSLRTVQFPEMSMGEDDYPAVALRRFPCKERPEPVHLVGSQGALRRIETDEEVQFLGAVAGVEPVMGGLEIGAEDVPLLEIDVMVARGEEECVGFRAGSPMEYGIGAGEVVLRVDEVAQVQRQFGLRSGVVLRNEIIQIAVRTARNMAVGADVDGIFVGTHIQVNLSNGVAIRLGLRKTRGMSRSVGREHPRHVKGDVRRRTGEEEK